MPFNAAVIVGSDASVAVGVIKFTDTLADSCTEDEAMLEVATVVSLTETVEVVGAAGYICASSTLTSSGRSLYHCGTALPVGKTISVSVPVDVGIAVFKTERTESLVGSMVAGSIVRANKPATAWISGCSALAKAPATSVLKERIANSFIVVA